MATPGSASRKLYGRNVYAFGGRRGGGRAVTNPGSAMPDGRICIAATIRIQAASAAASSTPRPRLFFVVCGLVDVLGVYIAETAGKSVVFHMLMPSEMSASLSEARSLASRRWFWTGPAHAFGGEGVDGVEIPVAAHEGDTLLGPERGEPAVDALRYLSVLNGAFRRRVHARQSASSSKTSSASPPPRFFRLASRSVFMERFRVILPAKARRLFGSAGGMESQSR